MWKISDFGLISEGTSKDLVTSRYVRGKSCYRAPELLMDGNFKYNNKMDVWALGCITYELYTGAKPFRSDYHALEYSKSGRTLHSFLKETTDTPQDLFISWIQDMLCSPPHDRPSAKTLKSVAEQVRQSKERGSPFSINQFPDPSD